MVNSPKPTQAPSSGQIEADTVARVPAAWLFDRASMIQPNSTGSANCATASSTLAIASSQPSRASGSKRLQNTTVEAKKRHS